MRNVLILFALLGQIAFAQSIEVTSIQVLKGTETGGYYYPVFDPQGNYLLTTGENYAGLNLHSLISGEVKILTADAGAGYRPSLSPDGKTIAYREVSYKDQLRYVAVKSMDLSSPQTVAEEMAPSRNFSGMDLTSGTLKMAQGKKEVSKKIKNNASVGDRPLVISEDGLIVIYKNGVRTELAPNGKDKRYVRPSVSPDGTKLVYTMVIPTCTYVCDIDGENPVALGYLNTPQWLGNHCIIGMTNKDDGHVVISSSIDMVTIDGKTRQTLTPASLKAMCPSVSADGKIVAFNTDKGEIYTMNINLK